VAAAKAIGGVEYAYALRGDGQEPPRPVSREDQERALAALLRTLRPSELAIPRAILERLPPRPLGFDPDRELFTRHTGATFDPIAPAEAAAGLTVAVLLEPQRAARLVAQRALEPALPVDAVLDRLVETVFDPSATSGSYEAEIARAVRVVAVNGVLRLAASASMAQVRALARAKLAELETSLAKDASPDEAERASRAGLAVTIRRFLEGKLEAQDLAPPPSIPPGEPIGDAGDVVR
jgi:hypothetical protein